MEEEEPANQTRYVYARYLNDYKRDKAAALEQLDLILKTESEESELYKQAERERDRLQSEEQEQEDGSDKKQEQEDNDQDKEQVKEPGDSPTGDPGEE